MVSDVLIIITKSISKRFQTHTVFVHKDLAKMLAS